MNPLSIRITGTGSAFPDKIFNNNELAREYGIDTYDEWIRERTGIVTRRMSDTSRPEERNSGLGTTAAFRALEMAGKKPEDVDQIIVATCSPDTSIPATACYVQKNLGAHRAWAFDLNAACSGWVYGLRLSHQAIMTGQARTVLLIGSDVLTPVMNWKDRGSSILFGDGAGATVIEACDVPGEGLLSTHVHSDGKFWDYILVEAGGSNMEVTPENFEARRHKMTLKGKEVFKVASSTLATYAKLALSEHGLELKDVDWFIPHQANLRIIEMAARLMKFPMEKVLINIDRYANTSAGTVPTALDEAVRSGRIKKGDRILISVFGAGLTYGSALIKW